MSSIDNSVPTFGLVEAIHNSTETQLTYQTGVYSPELAANIENGTTTSNLPLVWGDLSDLPAGDGGTLLSVNGLSAYASNNGLNLAVADLETFDYSTICTPCQELNLYASQDYGTQWRHFVVQGYQSAPSLAENFPTAVVVTSSGDDLATDMLNLTAATDSPEVIHGTSYSVGHYATLMLPDASPGEVAFVATLSNGAIWFYDSLDGGYTWQDQQIGTFATSPKTSPLDSIGDTLLSTTAGSSPGQIAAVVEGQTVFVLYTSYVDGEVVPVTLVSGNGGQTWSSPIPTPLPEGSAADPALAPSPAGYIYATWEVQGVPAPFIEDAVYSADGTLIQAPEHVPGRATTSDQVLLTPPSIAVDPFQRPLVVWGGSVGHQSPEIRYSGSFPQPAGALTVVSTQVANLAPADFANDQVGSFVSSLEANVSALENLVSKSPTKICTAQGMLASEIHHVDTHVALGYTNPDHTVCAGAANLSLALNPVSPVAKPTGYFPLNQMAASTFLAVADEWAWESLGVEINTSADPLPLAPPGVSPPIAVSPPSTGSSGNWGQTAYATVTALPESPINAFLQMSTNFPSEFNYDPASGTAPCDDYWVWTDTFGLQGNYQVNVSVDGQTGHAFGLSGSPPGVYLTNLTAGTVNSWTATFSAVYYETWSYYESYTLDGECLHASDSGGGDVTWGGLTVAGTVSTSLQAVPTPFADGHLIINAPAGSSNIYYNWTNTMPATSSAWLNSTGSPKSGSSAGYTRGESFHFTGKNGTSYTAALSATSYGGNWSSTYTPDYSAGQQTSASPMTIGFSCGFTLENVGLSMSQPAVSNIVANSATVTWYATKNGSGWVQYNEAGVGFNLSESATPTTGAPSPYSFTYTAELHGLSTFALYSLTGISTYYMDTCLVYESQSSTTFLTDSGFLPTASGYPYDSVTKTGGGMLLTWQMTPGLDSAFTNGTLSWTNDSNTSQVVAEPIPSSSSFWKMTGGLTYGLNFTPTGPNTPYTAVLTLNFTYSGSDLTAISSDINFTYLSDTTGDGLTYLEKVLGWEINFQTLSANITEGVGAEPNLFSTNGLVGDFVEKELGLNPNTVDTADSHMLDTWNLTFNLGPAGSAKLPATGFEYYYENSTNPFASLAGGSPAKANLNLTNLTPGTKAGINSGDGSPWAATVLWKNSALSTFENLSGVQAALFTDNGWLRATTGIWKGFRTITVWGKLSWGANPLATSTTNDGLADGNQPSPLEREAVQFNISSWSASLNLTGDEAAPYLTLSSGPGGTGTVYYQGYGPAEGDSGSTSVSYTGPYVVSVPVITSNQYAYYNLSINDQSNKKLFQRFSEGPSKIDLMNASVAYSLNGSQSGGSLKGGYTVLRVASAAPTLLWTPANNTTLSNVPWGLKRYTAEPDFDLLVLNLTSNNTVGGIGGTQGGWTYSLKLPAGLSNILVPRGAFLSSPLGQALLNNSNGTGTSLSGAGLSFTPKDWSGRVQQSTTSPSNSSYIRVFSTTSQSQNSSASPIYSGLPSNPALESGYESLQVQSVIWINVSSSGNYHFSGENAELKNLFGGLVLNEADNLTGDLLDVTSHLGTLGLPTNVLAAMANSTLTNGGSYAPPQYQQPPPSPTWWQSAGTWIWNTISGVALDVTKVLSVVWTAVQSAAAYIGEATAWLSNHLGLSTLSNQFAKTLKTVASAMEWALDQFLSYVFNLITAAFKAALVPLTTVLVSGIRSWASGWFAATNLSIAAYSGQNAATNSRLAANQISASIVPVILLGGAIGISIDVILAIATPLDIGASSLISLLIPILLTLLSTSQSWAGGSSWLGEVSSYISSGIQTTENWLDSATEWLFNHTQTINTTAASDIVASGVHGDFWSFFAFIATSGSFSFSYFHAGLTSTVTVGPQNAYLSIVYAAWAAVFGGLAYLVSKLGWNSGTMGHVELAGEASLAEISWLFGVLAIILGMRAVLGPGASIDAIPGAIGLGTGLVGLVLGGADLVNIVDEWPSA